MNKIFKVKKNALGQSVACSELATSRSKSRVVATALALAVASGVSMAQGQDLTEDNVKFTRPAVGENFINKYKDNPQFAPFLEALKKPEEKTVTLGLFATGAMTTILETYESVLTNDANITSLAKDVEVTKESLQAQIKANQDNSAINFTDTNAKIQANKDALEKKVEKSEFNEVRDHVLDKLNGYSSKISELEANKANVEADIAKNKAEVAKIEGLQAQITANQADSAKNFADTNANIKANKDALETKVEKRDFYHILDNVNSNNTEIAKLQANKADVEKTIAETVGYVNSVAEAADKNAMDIAENKAEVAKIGGLQAQITANQADSAKNFTDTNAKIQANKDALETKVEKRDFYHVQDNVNSNNTEIAKLQANKADVEYVDNVAEGVLANKVASATNKADIAENKAYLDSVAEGALANKVASTTNKADIAKNKKDIAANKEHVDVLTDTVIANKVDIVHNKAKIHMLETSTLDLTSTKARVSALENRTSALETRVNKLNKNLSAGIAGTAALSMMPTAGEKGAHYITAGAGHYNGQQAIAIGLTGNSNSGKFNYKVGASATTSGSPVVGAGVGYRWK